MAKQKKPAKKKLTKAEKEKRDKQKYIFVGLALVFFGVFGFFQIGFLGRSVTNVFRMIAGNTHYVLAIGVTVYGLLLIYFGGEPHFKKKRIPIGIFIFYIGLLLFLQARFFESQHGTSVNYIRITWQKLYSDIVNDTISQSVGGGMIGAGLYSLSYSLVDQLGTCIIAITLMFAGLLLVLNVQYEQIIALFDRFGHSVQGASQKVSDKRKEAREEKKQAKADEPIQPKNNNKKKNKKVVAEEIYPSDELNIVGEFDIDDINLEEFIKPEILPKRSEFEKQAAMKQEPKVESAVDSSPVDVQFGVAEEVEDLDYELPSSTLLNDIPVKDQSEDYEKIEKNIEILERTFKSFGVNIKVVRASLGPSVTKYELQPAVGVKVSKIVSLTDDIALALAAKDVRIEAPIPGKSLVGIEVPNSQVSTVAFRDIVEGSTRNSDKLLEVPLGRDISGSVITADLSKMPHLLIAGSTGSGKSVCINGIIISLLMNAKPHEVKLMMIDPKMVELNVYNGIPHLLTPVVTNPRKASQALHKVVEEMERRYELFAKSGMRNISGYNQFVKQKNQEEGTNHPTLPFIVVIVDELADLMMVASNEVEDAITRLAQMARAAGIHMILATQRPSVDVITGIIKANVPSRIAFAVSSGVDSRTIIDTAGAEKLLGRGDMLFLPMGENKPVRVQGAFISDAEVERVVSFVSSQQEANYVESMMPTDEVETPNEIPKDALYDDACQLVIEMQTASASLLQRRFRIGYNRAARIIDELEANHVIGPAEGSKPRKVFAQSLPTQMVNDEQEMEDNSDN